MIDNIKFKISDKDKSRFEHNLELNPLVTLKSSFDRITGEEHVYPKVGKLENIEIRITKNGASLKGSIHKYYNLISGTGNQNYNDFSFEQFKYAINDLCEKLNIDKEQTKITNLEFGFNISVNNNPRELIEKHILMYDLKDHNSRHNYRGKGSYKEFKKTDYSLKLYDKGKQFNLEKQLMRLELKITGSRYLKKYGIINLNQLGHGAFKCLFKAFITHYNKIMIVDSLNPPKELRLDQLVLFKNCVNPNHWSNIDIRERKETRKVFMKLVKKYKLDSTHSYLRYSIIEKYYLLMDLKSLQYA